MYTYIVYTRTADVLERNADNIYLVSEMVRNEGYLIAHIVIK